MRYPILRLISIGMGIIGFTLILLGIVSLITFIQAANSLPPTTTANEQAARDLTWWLLLPVPVSIVAGQFGGGLGLLLSSGLIRLLLDIEENTRSTALVLRRREQRLIARTADQPAPPNPARLDRLGEAPIREPVEHWQRPAVPRKILMK